MPTLNNPIEIARETFRQLAVRRIAPTPEHYRIVYHELSGTADTASPSFPAEALKAQLADLPHETPAQLRLARELEAAIRDEALPGYLASLSRYIRERATVESLNWGELIGQLLRVWETPNPQVTPGKKREALEHLVASTGGNPETLFTRLHSLVTAWAAGGEPFAASSGEGAELSFAAAGHTAATPHPLAQAGGELLPQLRDLLAFSLEHAVAVQIAESPDLAKEAKTLAGAARKAITLKSLDALLADMKRFVFRLELLADDRTELRQGLLHLLQLLTDNISALVLDDKWLHGQMAMVREIIGKPLSLRSIDDAERRIKEVVFKQAQLRYSLTEAQEALKTMLTGFVDHLVQFSDSTSDYHDKIDACAQKIGAAKDINSLADVVQDVMRETRIIQLNAVRSRDELMAARQKVEETEKRIQILQEELEKASVLIRNDALTGVLNRRGLTDAFEKESARALRRKAPLCVGLLDIDNFKKLNDTLGHDAGDAALIHLVQVIRDTLRPQDTVARIGGEEFLLLLPETEIKAGVRAIQRLQRELTKRFFLHDNQKMLITFSAGITLYRDDDTQATVTKRADEGLYIAKQTGKNRVVEQ